MKAKLPVIPANTMAEGIGGCEEIPIHLHQMKPTHCLYFLPRICSYVLGIRWNGIITIAAQFKAFTIVS